MWQTIFHLSGVYLSSACWMHLGLGGLFTRKKRKHPFSTPPPPPATTLTGSAPGSSTRSCRASWHLGHLVCFSSLARWAWLPPRSFFPTDLFGATGRVIELLLKGLGSRPVCTRSLGLTCSQVLGPLWFSSGMLCRSNGLPVQ